MASVDSLDTNEFDVFDGINARLGSLFEHAH
jgi:hypothetical protein